ncbi:related to 3-phytase precursor [Cephalotrichum gorgonifer]|uniref:Related to 3-phytase n=1 Tax=Cephalotrichum gorgonifer TaxID=2041049 RepID=A0AAE8N2D1_9PEZI|nr:related to 3-phytase precursor [Cephalotrichum gorgonifer]
MKAISLSTAAAALAARASAAAVERDLNVTALSGTFESDWTAVYYSDEPLLIGNDAGTSTGGLHTFDLNGDTPLPVVGSLVNGRTKLVTTVYDVDDKDWVLTITAPDSVIRAFSLPELEEDDDAQFSALGDWSSLCSWRSKTGNHYAYLFGKGQAIQVLVRSNDGSLEILEVQTFAMPFEASACAASEYAGLMYLGTDDDSKVYSFPLVESTAAPEVTVVGEAADSVTGLAVYATDKNTSDYIFVAQESVVGVYTQGFELLGTLKLAGLEDIEVQGLELYQAGTSKYPEGALTFAVEADNDIAGFGVSSLEGVAEDLDLALNSAFDPRKQACCPKKTPICKQCSKNGYCGTDSKCSCFAGFTGSDCSKIQCTDDCSGHGECVGPNQCKCEDGWGGLHCSFLVVEPKYETDENGADGDDPAIWIAPDEPENSRIITTTKSTEGAGLAVFDLKGNLLQNFPAGEPNNVDIIYGFPIGDRKVDLAFAACRADDTICIFEVTANGTLKDVPGGIQPTVDDYSVYGSCVYRSRKSGKQYLFVNEKSARYLQYELTATADGTLQTTLVRDFTGGSGGQVEGCVTDEDNGWLILGEEPSALWRYGAEPDSTDEPVRIAYVGDGKMHADVEGVTLVHGDEPDKGFIIVSGQGVSAYNVYRRAAPHEYVTTFTIPASSDGKIDGVTNTDGVAGVSTALGEDFPHGLLVVHDDSNQLPGGGTSDQSSFKLVSLEDILDADALEDLDLLDDVDPSWDPRA